MPSTYTVNLGIEKPATGEQSGTWGDTTNINFDILDQAINGCLSLTLASAGTSGSPNTLAISDGATSDGRNKWIEFVDGGDLGATAYVQLTPNDAEKIVFIRNSLSGSRSVILFQGTYDAGRDLEVPAGVDMVVKFSGGGATATTTDIFTKLRATEITTPTLTTDDLTAGTADINDGTVEAVIGGTTPKAGTFTNLTANTNLSLATGATVTGINTTTNMSDASATTLATSLSIKTYVDDQVATVDTLAEVLANGNTSGANNLIIDSGQALTTNTINETTGGTGVTIDSVLLKDDGVNATNLEITNIKANDGTAAGSIANSTGAVTITSFISNSVDIGGGAIDDTVIGGTTANTGTFTTLTGATINATTVIDTPDIELTTISSRDGTTAITILDAADAIGLGVAPTASWNDAIVGVQFGASGAAYSSSTSQLNLLANMYYGASGFNYLNSDEASSYTQVGGVHTFYVAPSGTADAAVSLTEALRINNSGEVIVNEGGGDQDFRIESDNEANMLFLDAGNGRIGIRNGAPDATFDIKSSADNTFSDTLPYAASSNDTLAVYNSPGASADNYTSINIQARGLQTAAMRHILVANNAGGGGGDGTYYMQFRDSADTVNTTTRLKITSEGAITTYPLGAGETVFNEDGNNHDFRVEGSTEPYMLWIDASTDKMVIGGTQVGDSERLSIRDDVDNSASNWYNARSGMSLYNTTQSAGYGDSVGILQEAHSGEQTYWYTEAPSNTEVVGHLGARTSSENNRDVISWTTTGVIVNDDSYDVNFRVESNTNNAALFVDAGNDRVGILNSSPDFALDVGPTNAAGGDGIQINATRNATLRFLGNDTSMQADEVTGRIEWYTSDTNFPGIHAQILTRATNTNASGELQIWSGTAGSIKKNVYFRGDSSVFNEDSNDMDFRVESDSNTHMLFVDANNNRFGVRESAPSAALHVTSSDGGNYASIIRHSAATNPNGLLVDYSGSGDTNTFAFLVRNTARDILDVRGTGSLFHKAYDGGAVVFNEGGNDADFRVESDGNNQALWVDAANDVVKIGGSGELNPSMVLQLLGAMGLMQSFTVNSTTSRVAEGTGGLFLCRDDTYGGVALVLYEFAFTPIIIAQTGSNFTTSTPTGTQVQFTGAGSPAPFGMNAVMASGQSTILRGGAIICDPS